MSIRDAFVWLGDTGAGRFLADSTPAFAATESAHILFFGLLGGAFLAVDLAALGVILPRYGAVRLARAIFPFFLIALGGATITGVLLVAAGPLNYYANPLFPWKLAVLLLATIIHLAIYPGLFRDSPIGRGARAGLAVLGVISLLAWLSVAIIGRWLGLI